MPQTGRPQFCILTRPGSQSLQCLAQAWCGGSYTGTQVCVCSWSGGGGCKGIVSSSIFGAVRWKEEGLSKEELEGEVSTIMKEDHEAVIACLGKCFTMTPAN